MIDIEIYRNQALGRFLEAAALNSAVQAIRFRIPDSSPSKQILMAAAANTVESSIKELINLGIHEWQRAYGISPSPIASQ